MREKSDFYFILHQVRERSARKKCEKEVRERSARKKCEKEVRERSARSVQDKNFISSNFFYMLRFSLVTNSKVEH
jgi:hypothetical protein